MVILSIYQMESGAEGFTLAGDADFLVRFGRKV